MTKPILTVGMLTHDDYHGVYFTINAIRMYHADVADKLHFVVIDNNPDQQHGQETKRLVQGLPNATYHEIRGVSSTSFRNLVFELSPADHVLCLDCHVLLWPKAISRLVAFYEDNPDFHDLIQGPLVSETGTIYATEMLPTWRGGNFGIWHNSGKADDETADMFEIPMHGMGLFACSRVGWPRFTAGMRHFGAEEGTIHEKFRLLGRKCWCFPFLRWLHRFGRPGGPNYRNTSEDKVRNYLLTFTETQLPIESIEDYWKHRLSGNKQQSEAKMEELMFWAQTLPPSPFPQAQHDRFLGEPIKIAD